MAKPTPRVRRPTAWAESYEARPRTVKTERLRAELRRQHREILDQELAIGRLERAIDALRAQGRAGA